MICEKLPMPNGTVAIVCSRRRPHPKCRCGSPSTKQCDFPKGDGRTCDKHLCNRCAVSIGPDVDHCPDHPKSAPAQGALDL